MNNMVRGKASKSCFYYWFVEPLKSQYKDDGSLQAAFEFPVKAKFGECKLALFLGPEGLPNFVRFKIPGFTSEELKKEHVELLQVVREHLLSMLRIMYDSTTQFAPVQMWAFLEEGKPYSQGISIQQLLGNRIFHTTAIHNAFIGTWSKRTEIKLLADALDERVPLNTVTFHFIKYWRITLKVKANGRKAN